MKNCRPMYAVYLEDSCTGTPICCLETRSINSAINFISTVDRDICIIEFFRHHPFKKFDIDEILECVK